MSCASCVATVEGALRGIDGVTAAVANLTAEKAFVTFDTSRVRLADLERAIQDVGYEVGREDLSLQISGGRWASWGGGGGAARRGAGLPQQVAGAAPRRHRREPALCHGDRGTLPHLRH